MACNEFSFEMVDFTGATLRQLAMPIKTYSFLRADLFGAVPGLTIT